MTLLKNSAEGGTDGTTVTTANSGGTSGTAFSAVAPGTPASSISFRAADAFHGTLCYYQQQLTTANTCTFDLTESTPADSWTFRSYFYLIAYPTATVQGPFHIRSAANASLAQVRLTTTGQWQLNLNATGTATTGTLSLLTWYRAEWTGTGLNTATSACQLDTYLGDSTTPLTGLSATMTGQTTTALAGITRIGRNSATGTNDWLIDDIAVNIGSATALGPEVQLSSNWSYGTDVRIG